MCIRDSTFTIAAAVATTSADIDTAGNTKTVDYDAVAPTATLTAKDPDDNAISLTNKLKKNETATITITFLEDVTFTAGDGEFSSDDTSAAGGDASDWATTSDAKVYTLVFTPTDNSNTNGAITLGDNRAVDSYGNNNIGFTLLILADTDAPDGTKHLSLIHISEPTRPY